MPLWDWNEKEWWRWIGRRIESGEKVGRNWLETWDQKEKQREYEWRVREYERKWRGQVSMLPMFANGAWLDALISRVLDRVKRRK